MLCICWPAPPPHHDLRARAGLVSRGTALQARHGARALRLLATAHRATRGVATEGVCAAHLPSSREPPPGPCPYCCCGGGGCCPCGGCCCQGCFMAAPRGLARRGALSDLLPSHVSRALRAALSPGRGLEASSSSGGRADDESAITGTRSDVEIRAKRCAGHAHSGGCARRWPHDIRGR